MYHPGVRSRVDLGALAIGACAALAGCGGDAIRIELVPVEAVPGGACGRPGDARVLLVTALGDFPAKGHTLDPSGPVAFDDFPVETRQFTVEILGDGGALRAIGKTAPLVLGDLADGTVVPVMMAPPEGFCPVGAMGAARDRPLVVRLGAGALVLGGADDGAPLHSAEYYDPASGRFSPVAVPSVYATPLAFTGAAATALPDGSAIVTGGASAAYVVFLPTGAYQAPGALGQVRAYHAAVALPGERVALYGGCTLLNQTSGACEPGSADPAASRIIDLGNNGDVGDGPRAAIARLGGSARLEASGDDLAGPPGLLVVGGVDATGQPVTQSERADPGGTAVATTAPGGPGLAAPLPGGAVLVGFAPPGAAAAGAAAVIPPGGAAVPVGGAAPRADAALVALEDGGVIALGDGAPARYVPARATWRALGAAGEAPIGLTGHGAVRLDDGTVLVVGGHDASGTAQAGAWIYRPSLVGPFAGAATATPSVADADAPLDPLDPSAVTVDANGWRLAGRGAGLGSWAVLTGPTFADGALEATVRPTGGFAAMLGFTAPDRFDAAVLVPGQPARLERHRDGAIDAICDGAIVEPFPADPAVGVAIALTRAGDAVTVTIATRVVLACEVPAGERGAFGLGPIGPATLGIAIASARR